METSHETLLADAKAASARAKREEVDTAATMTVPVSFADGTRSPTNVAFASPLPASSTGLASPGCDFGRLPPELRAMIYELADFNTTGHKHVLFGAGMEQRNSTYAASWRERRLYTGRDILRLRLVCRQITEEIGVFRHRIKDLVVSINRTRSFNNCFKARKGYKMLGNQDDVPPPASGKYNRVSFPGFIINIVALETVAFSININDAPNFPDIIWSFLKLLEKAPKVKVLDLEFRGYSHKYRLEAEVVGGLDNLRTNWSSVQCAFPIRLTIFTKVRMLPEVDAALQNIIVAEERRRADQGIYLVEAAKHRSFLLNQEIDTKKARARIWK